MHRISLCSLAAFAALCLYGSLSPAHATIDMALNTSNYANDGQAFTASVDGVITDGGESFTIVGAAVMVRFDPAKVTISNLHTESGSGWSLLGYNTDHLSEGWLIGVLYNSSDYGQTEDGPIMQFTVTPANSTVDVAECDTLKLSGSESDLCDDGFWDYIPSDPCAGIYAPSGGPDEGEGGRMGPMGLDSLLPPGGQPDVIAGTRALKIAGGLSAARDDELAFLDRNTDGKITISDAVAVLRAPVVGPPRAYQQGFQAGNSSNMPAIADIDNDTHHRLDAVFTSDDQNPPVYNANPYHSGNPNAVYAITDTTGYGDFGMKPGWSRPMRDGPYGLALADINSSGTLAVLATNFQDEYGDNLDPNFNIQSHLYAWDYLGGGIQPFSGGHYRFATDTDPDNPTAIGVGHSIAAPAVLNNAGGNPSIFYTYQGHEDDSNARYVDGGMQILRLVNNIVQTTASQSTSPTSAWYTLPYTDSLFDASPAFPSSATGARNVVLASETGLVYRWDTDGTAKANWYPAATNSTATDNFAGIGGFPEPAPIKKPLVAANIDGVAGDEVLACSGNVYNYWGFFGYSADTLDGAVYCWDAGGAPQGLPKWRYPAFKPGFDIQDFGPAVTSGVSVGHLLGSTSPLCVAFGNAEGEVTALNNNGQLLWKYTVLPKAQHPAYRPINTQPIIVDVNGDGYQDVIVGNANGYVYALDGRDGHELWHAVTFISFDSNYYGIIESHYEEVKGLAAANMDSSDATRLTLVVTTGTVQLQNNSPRVGHAMILEAATGTFSPLRADWPQYQQNAQRTGVYPGP